jgi:hypothetical protein
LRVDFVMLPRILAQYAFGGSMFTLLRSVLIIGVIFYLSPERQAQTGSPEGATVDDEVGKRVPLALDAKTAEATWKKMAVVVTEEAVRHAVQDRADAAGLRLKDHAWSVLDRTQKAIPAKDGARSQETDLKVSGQAVRCVYRCDGAE